jgi:hypothetical protein
MLPAGAEVTLLEPSKGAPLTYMIQVTGDRSRVSAMLPSVVEVVSTTEERWSLLFEVHGTRGESPAYSSIDLPDTAVRSVGILGRAHDELLELSQSQSVSIDAEDGSFTITDVPRASAMTSARAAARSWEDVVRDTDGRWSDSTLSIEVGVGIGVDGEHPEIIYSATVEREPDPMGYRRSATGSEEVSDAEWAERVFTAWDDNLPLLEAMLRLPVPADHAATLSFFRDSLKPRLSVTHHETHEDDLAAAKELVASIRTQVPGTKLKAY